MDIARKLRKKLGWYSVSSFALTVVAVGYVLLLQFPQPLFAYSMSHKHFDIYAREPLGEDLVAVLDKADARLQASPLNDASDSRPVFLTGRHGMYTLLSHTAYKSFGNSVPLIGNIFINKADIASDRVFLNREKNNSRSLSGVIAHEVMHLLIQKRYGTVTSMLMPTWKKEGYCEYVAGDSTITLEEGIRLWRENPSNDPAYRYVKYHLMVKHLLENEKMSVDDLFTTDLDEKQIAERTFAALGN